MNVTKPVFLIQYKCESSHLSVCTFAFYVMRTCSLSIVVDTANLVDGFVGYAVRVNLQTPNICTELILCYWSVMNTFTCCSNSILLSSMSCLKFLIFWMAFLHIYKLWLVMKRKLFGPLVINHLSYLRVLKQYQHNKYVFWRVMYMRKYVQYFSICHFCRTACCSKYN